MKTPKNYDALAIRIREALAKGVKACKSVPDGGSFNRDYVQIPVGKDCFLPRKSKAFEEALTRAGVGFRFSDARMRGYALRFSGPTGQASRHTAACEATMEDLKDLGAFIMYILD